MPLTRFVLAAFLLAPVPAAAQEAKADKPKPAEVKKDRPPSVTRHTFGKAARPFEYQATAGTLPIKDDAGKTLAEMFYVSYTKVGTDPATRPVTFTFNGGPGSSSVWLHMGAFGPKRVVLTDEGEAPPPPYTVVENEFSLLDQTDLVFIDPVSTGFSRAAEGQNPKQFHGVQEDVQAVGEFVRLWVTRNGRWGSPKFLAGESYGTTRAAALAGHLQDRLGINLNGVVLVSAVLNFQTIRFADGNDLPPALYLPSYAATAWYHKRLPSDLQAKAVKQVADEAAAFARGEYTLALMKGDKLTAEERDAVADKVARLTGLSPDYVKQTNLRVEIMRFTKELLRRDRRTVGRFDSRLKGIDADAAGESHEYDPSYASVQGPYTAAVNRYFREELKYETDEQYEILTGKVQPWDYGTARNRYLNVAPTLRSAMTKNRDLRVFVANGLYDLATPFCATDYTVDHLGLEQSFAGHVTTEYYEAGHMMYAHKPSHRKLAEDLRRWFEGAKAGR